MSHYLYYVCLSHDPGEESGEAGHNLSQLNEMRADLARRDEIVDVIAKIERDDEMIGADFYEDRVRTRRYFLYHHPRCEIGIRDQYGKWYDVEGESEEPIEKPRGNQGGVWVRYAWNNDLDVKSIHISELEARRVAESYEDVVFVYFGDDVFHSINRR